MAVGECVGDRLILYLYVGCMYVCVDVCVDVRVNGCVYWIQFLTASIAGIVRAIWLCICPSTRGAADLVMAMKWMALEDWQEQTCPLIGSFCLFPAGFPILPAQAFFSLFHPPYLSQSGSLRPEPFTSRRWMDGRSACRVRPGCFFIFEIISYTLFHVWHFYYAWSILIIDFLKKRGLFFFFFTCFLENQLSSIYMNGFRRLLPLPFLLLQLQLLLTTRYQPAAREDRQIEPALGNTFAARLAVHSRSA